MAGELPTQAEMAVKMYTNRAETYEDSWHPDYSRRLLELVPLEQGHRVFSLCCGTGLDAFLAASKVCPSGSVIGVDITPSMLAVAQGRQARDTSLQPPRVQFIEHDVMRLDTLRQPDGAPLVPASVDVIICSNALCLLGEPDMVLRAWRPFLRPGALLVVDVPHENNLRAGKLLERVARQMHIAIHADRTWVQDVNSMSEVLRREGFDVETAVELVRTSEQREMYYSLDQADEQFDYTARTTLSEPLMTPELKERARALFREEWVKEAGSDGKLELVNSMYAYVARKRHC